MANKLPNKVPGRFVDLISSLIVFLRLTQAMAKLLIGFPTEAGDLTLEVYISGLEAARRNNFDFEFL